MKKTDVIDKEKIVKLAGGFMLHPYSENNVSVLCQLPNGPVDVQVRLACTTYWELLAALWGEANRLDSLGHNPIWKDALMLGPMFYLFDDINQDNTISIMMPEEAPLKEGEG